MGFNTIDCLIMAQLGASMCVISLSRELKRILFCCSDELDTMRRPPKAINYFPALCTNYVGGTLVFV
jgi:hypothetical protein